jgi:tetratricopeptide (TPR) repeat protein
MSWKVIRNLRNNSSIDEEIPSMLNELAFRIGLYLAEIQGSKNDLPPNWEIYQKLAKGDEYLDNYFISNNRFDLEEAKDQVHDAANYGYNYQESISILSNIALFLIMEKDNCSEAKSILLFCRPFYPVKCDLGLGLAFNKERNYNDSITACDRVLQTDPTNVAGLIIRGDSLAGLENYNESLYDYNNAINNFAKSMSNNSALEMFKFEEDSASMLCKKGYALCRLDRYNEALRSLDDATDLGKDLAEAWYWKGWVLNEMGNYPEANQALENAAKLDQDNFVYWDEKAYALNRMGEYIESIRACDQGIQLNPYNYGAWYCKVWILNNGSEAMTSEAKLTLERALQSFEEAIGYEPSNADFWYSKGCILDLLGNNEEAESAFAMADMLGYNQ